MRAAISALDAVYVTPEVKPVEVMVFTPVPPVAKIEEKFRAIP